MAEASVPSHVAATCRAPASPCCFPPGKARKPRLHWRASGKPSFLPTMFCNTPPETTEHAHAAIHFRRSPERGVRVTRILLALAFTFC